MDPFVIQKAAEFIREADALLIGAGAGMGVDSGLPDFRGTEGFWNAYPAFQELGLSFYDLANPYWFTHKPPQAWGFYGHRLQLYRETTPHRGFEILLQWARHKPAGCFVFTSNVDGHFQRAGFPEERVVECHGSLNHLQCVDRCGDQIWLNEDDVSVDSQTLLASEPLPVCPVCGGLARPNVLMFDDFGWVPTRTEQQWDTYQRWLASIAGKRLVVIECGAGTAVPTVRHECERRGGQLVRLNPREADGPRQCLSLSMGALSALEQIDQTLSRSSD